jgi:Cu2+-exporting ATPase
MSGTGMIWIDKTGTLTSGKLSMVRWYGDLSIRPIVAAIQGHSSHPVAVAMARDLSKLASTDAEIFQNITCVEQTAIVGIQACYRGQLIQIGNRRFVELERAEEIEPFVELVNAMLAEGIAPVFVAVDHRVVAVAGVGDPLRDDARSSLDEIRRLGWSVGILSGDHREIVTQVAKQLSIPAELAIGELTPEEKTRWVQPHGDSQAIVMVGDGVNDSAALASAAVGIAVRRGAEASLAAAPVYLAREGLGDLVHLIHLARKTMLTIRWNIAASLSYNLLAVGLAAAGFISPLLAAILMPISSLTVVSISLLMPRA